MLIGDYNQKGRLHTTYIALSAAHFSSGVDGLLCKNINFACHLTLQNYSSFLWSLNAFQKCRVPLDVKVTLQSILFLYQ